MKRWTLLVAILMPFVPAQASAANATLLGVLENPQCKENTGAFVRVLFAQKDRSWISLSNEGAARGHIASRMLWTIAFDGKKVGNVGTIDSGSSAPESWTYPRDRLLNLAPDQSISYVPNAAKRFNGWCQAPQNRPLAVVSQGWVSDPDIWKPTKASNKDIALLFSSFQTHAGPALICSNKSETGVPYRYGGKDLEVLTSYKDKAGRQLITLQLKRPKITDMCSGPIDVAWATHSFLLATKAVYLGSGLDLVDAGDYDNDGNSEILFWHSGYNKDGYVMFFDNFTSKAEYLWSYH